MTSSERVLTALRHREADRIPRDLGGTESSGMTACSLSKLQNHLRLESEIKIFDPYQYVGYVGEDIRDRFRID
ncbi:MAG: methyltransferase, partial [Lentisphaerota bacterium]